MPTKAKIMANLANKRDPNLPRRQRITKREKVQAMTTSNTAATPALSHNNAS